MQSPVPTSWMRNAQDTVKLPPFQPCTMAAGVAAPLSPVSLQEARLTEDAPSERSSTKYPNQDEQGTIPINTFRIKKKKSNGGHQGLEGERMRSYCSVDTEFRLGKMRKAWRWMAVMVCTTK